MSRREFLRRAVRLPFAMVALRTTQRVVPSEVAAAAPATTKPKRGGTFVALAHSDVSSLSPDDAGPLVHAVLSANIHEGLVRVDENYNVIPKLAQSYDISPDGLVYTFRLRRGVKWHDGKGFTAADVRYTYEWVLRSENATVGRPVFMGIDRIETPDPYTVIIRLQQPTAPFLILGSSKAIIPKHHHEKIGEQAYKHNPIGTGPYKFKKHEVGKYVLLEAFDDYWDGRPWIKFFRQDFVPDPAARAMALETGKADASIVFLDPDDALRLIHHPRLQYFRAAGTAVNHFALNHRQPLFRDKRVRQAMMYALDRDAMIADLLKDQAVKATANLSPAIRQYYESNVRQYDYNPAQAQALLGDAGWKPGPDGILANAAGERFSVVCDILQGDTVRREQAEMAQGNFRAVGIEMRLRELESTAFWRVGSTGTYDMALFNWTYGGTAGDPDARRALACEGLYNRSKWCNKDADRLMDEGARAVETAKRREIYSDLQKLVADEVPFLFISFWKPILLFNKRLKGLPPAPVPNPVALFWVNFHKYWIDE